MGIITKYNAIPKVFENPLKSGDLFKPNFYQIICMSIAANPFANSDKLRYSFEKIVENTMKNSVSNYKDVIDI